MTVSLILDIFINIRDPNMALYIILMSNQNSIIDIVYLYNGHPFV